VGYWSTKTQTFKKQHMYKSLCTCVCTAVQEPTSSPSTKETRAFKHTTLLPPLQKDEFLTMAINGIQNDLNSRNEAFQCIALSFVANSEHLGSRLSANQPTHNSSSSSRGGSWDNSSSSSKACQCTILMGSIRHFTAAAT
jgi:hypothetical protein